MGWLGSSYYFGSFITIVAVPWLADEYGRKKIIVSNMLICAIALIGLLFTHSYNLAIFFIMIVGVTFPGNYIISFFLFIEYTNPSKLYNILYWCMYSYPVLYFMFSLYFGYIDRTMAPIEVFFIVMGIVSALWIYIYVPETPKFLLSKGKYEEARESIRQMARFNNVKDPF